MSRAQGLPQTVVVLKTDPQRRHAHAAQVRSTSWQHGIAHHARSTVEGSRRQRRGTCVPTHPHLEALRAGVLGCIQGLVLAPAPPPLLQRRKRHLAAQGTAALGSQRLAGVLPPGGGVLVHRHLRPKQAQPSARFAHSLCGCGWGRGASEQTCLFSRNLLKDCTGMAGRAPSGDELFEWGCAGG